MKLIVKSSILAILTGAALLGLASSAFAQARLNAGEYLFPPQKLVADGCYFELVMQGDGNLVTYTSASLGGGSAWWASNTLGTGGYATMQGDGNFVIYNWSDQPVWASNTLGQTPDQLIQQDDGNLVIYQNQPSLFRDYPVWASGVFGAVTTQPCRTTGEKTVVQPNTNLFGSDYTHINLPVAGRPSWCGYYCANDNRCAAYTYVPPGVQAQNAVCWLKTAVPRGSYAQGLISGFKIHQ